MVCYICVEMEEQIQNLNIGLLGGGQLGRMMLQEAYNWNLNIHVLDPDEHAPCNNIATSFTVGDFRDYETVLSFGQDKDIMTIEFEDVNVEALEALEKMGKKVYPQPAVLRIIKDKGLQKEFYRERGIPTAPYFLANNAEEVKQGITNYPVFQKLRTSGYDGYGVTRLEGPDDEIFDAPSMVEQGVEMEKELSVIVARNANGDTAVFPVVELEFNQEANMVAFLFSPASIDTGREEEARALAVRVIDEIGMVGLLAVEMFLSKDGELMVNEIAPRPHNSGHQSIEGNVTSQFQQHLRSILNLPLGDTSITNPSVMVNLLGEKGYKGEAVVEGEHEILGLPGVYIHLYGKRLTKPFRKMGHVCIVNKDINEAKRLALHVKNNLKIKA